MDYTKHTKILLTSLLFIILLLIGFSFSYFQNVKTTDSIKKFNTDCFDISYMDKTEGINLEKAYPISDEEGLNTTPYTFSVTNTCPYDMNLNIKINIIRNTTLDNKYIKVSLDNDVLLEPTQLSEMTEASYDNTVYIDSRILKTVELNQYETIEVDFRMWLDKEATGSEGSNAYLSSKIEVEGFNK